MNPPLHVSQSAALMLCFKRSSPPNTSGDVNPTGAKRSVYQTPGACVAPIATAVEKSFDSLQGAPVQLADGWNPDVIRSPSVPPY
ncbi:MAG: hypothetical protein IPN88_11790 [Bacteroidetes bacterium]|nr:hypothetical protein [Bacteroidota bacterium]